MEPSWIGAPEAAKRLGLNYHAFLYWIRENLHGIGDASMKVGHNWIIREDHIESVRKKLRETA